MKYSFLLLLSFVFYACSNNTKNVIVTTFEESGELISTEQKIPVSILAPRAMIISNDNLFIYKEKGDALFDVFELPDCRYICSVGNRGQGPDDFNFLDPRSLQATNDGFKVMEAGSNILKTVEFKDGFLRVSKSEKILLNNPSNNGFYLLNDSTYLTLGVIGEMEEYCLYNKRTESITKTGSYPKWTDKNKNEATDMFFTYLKSCAVHPNGERVASFYGRFKRIRVYDHAMQLLHDIDVRIEPYVKDIEEDIMDQYQFYIGQPYPTKDCIYVLCFNSKANDNETERNAVELQIWDWDGIAIGRYKFEKKIALMAVSEKYKKIYALDRSADDKIYIYDMPNFKK